MICLLCARMPKKLPYVIDYVPQKEIYGGDSFMPKQKVALLLTGSSPEITGHQTQRVPFNASIVQTIDTLIKHNYDLVHVLGHGDLIHRDPFYGYSTLLTGDHLEKEIQYLQRILTPNDLLLVAIRGLHIDTRGTFLSLYDKTDIFDFELRNLLRKIPARQILYCSLGALVPTVVSGEQEGGIMPICISPTKPTVSALSAPYSLSPLSASSRFYSHFFSPLHFSSLYDRFKAAALETIREDAKQSSFCAYLRHSSDAHAEKNML